MAMKFDVADGQVSELAIWGSKLEGQLQGYFARDGVLCEPSNFGAMCERASAVAHSSVPCPECLCTGCSRLSPEEMVERARRVAEDDAETRRLLRSEPDEEKRAEIGEERRARRERLTSALLAEAACKSCGGSGYRKPRRIRRGAGDSVWTTVRCPKCYGSAGVGRPERWQIRRFVLELRDLPGSGSIRPAEVVSLVRATGAALPAEGRWGRALEALRSLAASGVPGGWAEPLVDPESPRGDELDVRGMVRALYAGLFDPCPRCAGSSTAGSVIPVTVRETGSSVRASGGHTVSEVDVKRHGELSRLIGKTETQSKVAAAVLRAYFGPDGNCWSRRPEGRIFAIWPLTRPGAVLAREAAVEFAASHGGVRVTPCEALSRLRTEERKSVAVNRRRRAMLDQADKAARSLLDLAKRTWVGVVRGDNDPEAFERVVAFEADTDELVRGMITSVTDASIAQVDVSSGRRSAARAGSGVE